MNSARPGNVLIIDDEEVVRHVVSDAMLESGFTVETAEDAESGLGKLRGGAFDVAFVDINLPGMSGFELLAAVSEETLPTDVVIMTGKTTVANAVEATRRGAYDYVTKPFDLDALVVLAHKIADGRMADTRAPTPAPPPEETGGVSIIGQSAPMQAIYKVIGRIAGSAATVLIQGESGTGKEVIARAIHAFSDRADQPFIAVNCSAIPAELLESEMFGHERGSFTGAAERRIGKFEQAGRGTLMLDEISDMPPGLQAKLLRVLQEREYSRVGGRELLPAKCRIVAATNRDLEGEVAAGRFREDLYFRIKVVVIELPALRERREDIPLLVEHFVSRINQREDFAVAGVSRPAMELLSRHVWPGNVRELENVLLRAAALAPNRVLAADDLPLSAPQQGDLRLDPTAPLVDIIAAGVRSHLQRAGSVLPRDLHADMIAMVEKPLFETVLAQTDGNQVRAAEILGINRNTLRKKITEYRIPLRKDLE